MEQKEDKRRKKHTADDVIAAIAGSGGIRLTISKRLQVHRHTVERYLRAYPSAMIAYTNEINSVGDLVESVILEAIQAKDIETAKWYAKNKLKDRGYSERQEVTGEDGKPIRFIVEVPPKAETADEWMQQYTTQLSNGNGG